MLPCWLEPDTGAVKFMKWGAEDPVTEIVSLIFAVICTLLVCCCCYSTCARCVANDEPLVDNMEEDEYAASADDVYVDKA
eukprot:3307854-Rhodomonas_salina.2